jgi:hypothetical protein
MTTHSLPIWLVAAVATLLVSVTLALEVGLTDHRHSPKRDRNLLQGTRGAIETKKPMAATAVKFCAECPPIHGYCRPPYVPTFYYLPRPSPSFTRPFTPPISPFHHLLFRFLESEGKADLSIKADAGGSSNAPTWVVVMHKLPGCEPHHLCNEAAAIGKGRFSGECSETYGTAIRGMAVKVRGQSP